MKPKRKAENLEKFVKSIAGDGEPWEWVSNNLGILERRLIPKPRGKEVRK